MRADSQKLVISNRHTTSQGLMAKVELSSQFDGGLLHQQQAKRRSATSIQLSTQVKTLTAIALCLMPILNPVATCEIVRAMVQKVVALVK
jgi:hypothetical protein